MENWGYILIPTLIASAAFLLLKKKDDKITARTKKADKKTKKKDTKTKVKKNKIIISESEGSDTQIQPKTPTLNNNIIAESSGADDEKDKTNKKDKKKKSIKSKKSQLRTESSKPHEEKELEIDTKEDVPLVKEEIVLNKPSNEIMFNEEENSNEGWKTGTKQVSIKNSRSTISTKKSVKHDNPFDLLENE